MTMDAYQIVPCDASNPTELDPDAIERLLRTPDRLPAVNDLESGMETVSDPPYTRPVVVPDADDPMGWNLELFFANWEANQEIATSEGMTTSMAVDQSGLNSEGYVGYNGDCKGKGKEQLGPSSNYYGTNYQSQSQSQDCYYNGETSAHTGGFDLAAGVTNPVNEPQQLSAWPVQQRAPNCVCCQVLREIVHSNGEMVTAKLEIHGIVGMICHAILQRRYYFMDRPVESHYEFIDYSNKCLEEVKHSLEEYCAAQEREGFFIEKDSLSMFYETLCVGYDWNESMEDHFPTAFGAEEPQQQPAREENEGGKAPPNKTNLSQQRERAAKLTLKDLAEYFDYPIQEAARALNLCPTVLKKVCRQEGVPRWPHRKVKSLKKQMEKVKKYMNSNVYSDEQYASMQVSLNRLQQDLDTTVAGGKNVE